MTLEEYIRTHLTYDPITGLLRRKLRNKTHIVNTIHKSGYIRIKLFGKNFQIHRVIWFITHGYWPNVIDHINHIRHDNRLINLRDVSHLENMDNQKTSKDGIRFIRTEKKWRATLSLGLFSDENDAAAAIKEARLKLTTKKAGSITPPAS